MSAFRVFLAFACALLLASPWRASAEGIETRQVRFAKGASSSTIQGTLRGDKTIDYKLRARAGQNLSVTLKTSNGGNYFNVLPPRSNDVAIFVGSTSGNEFSAALPADGEYTIRVYLMRSAARRNELATYTLSVGITGAGGGRPGDAKVKGTPYHAVGQVPCSMGSAPTGSQQCPFGVIRGQVGSGHAQVEVTPPGGTKRVLTFDGAKVSADGNGNKVKASKVGDNWNVEVNDHEHYSIPQAVISGG